MAHGTWRATDFLASTLMLAFSRLLLLRSDPIAGRVAADEFRYVTAATGQTNQVSALPFGPVCPGSPGLGTKTARWNRPARLLHCCPAGLCRRLTLDLTSDDRYLPYVLNLPSLVMLSTEQASDKEHSFRLPGQAAEPRKTRPLMETETDDKRDQAMAQGR